MIFLLVLLILILISKLENNCAFLDKSQHGSKIKHIYMRYQDFMILLWLLWKDVLCHNRKNRGNK